MKNHHVWPNLIKTLNFRVVQLQPISISINPLFGGFFTWKSPLLCRTSSKNYLAVGITWPPPRWIGSLAILASKILNLVFRIGSSHKGPSRVPHWKPWTMESFTEPKRPLSTSDGKVSSTKILGPKRERNKNIRYWKICQVCFYVKSTHYNLVAHTARLA